LKSEIEIRELNNVGELHDDTVERLEPFVQKVKRQTLGAFAELGIGDGLFAIDNRDAISVFGEDVGEYVPQGMILPISFGSIAFRKLGRKSNNAS
jgi:hypothetical protein